MKVIKQVRKNSRTKNSVKQVNQGIENRASLVTFHSMSNNILHCCLQVYHEITQTETRQGCVCSH